MAMDPAFATHRSISFCGATKLLFVLFVAVEGLLSSPFAAAVRLLDMGRKSKVKVLLLRGLNGRGVEPIRKRLARAKAACFASFCVSLEAEAEQLSRSSCRQGARAKLPKKTRYRKQLREHASSPLLLRVAFHPHHPLHPPPPIQLLTPFYSSSRRRPLLFSLLSPLPSAVYPVRNNFFLAGYHH
ncbi:hypothetical protein FN846DRAFT_373397 [Sphaerosporella brunnea]|uniref:Uncharacterized protein n=1 Tax=Sphaerosporella brunnea TaxID=1250544 RepID=A0A5J5EHF5_9PEZI|nr:hypothetical protein FN846DRAFT_373397 [Sphaerosporella brunnea]